MAFNNMVKSEPAAHAKKMDMEKGTMAGHRGDLEAQKANAK